MGKIHGAKRVLAFCILTALLPAILIITPLYLRHHVFANVTYPVAESDVLAIKDGVSSIFCESHSLHMNTSFNAFQLSGKPKPSKKLKHIRLKKSMSLPDDTFEYWGFFLPKGSIVKLRVCSRYDGSRILVVRGEKNLKTCGLLQHNLQKYGAKMDEEHNRVKVTFENAAEVLGVFDNQNIDMNTAAEDFSDDKLKSFEKKKLNITKTKHHQLENLATRSLVVEPIEDNLIVSETSENKSSHLKRHVRSRTPTKKQKLLELQAILDSNDDSTLKKVEKRDVAPLDAHIKHGGNNADIAKTNDSYITVESSISSFETDLLSCYDGQILLSKGFPPSHLCQDVHHLEHSGSYMQTEHEVASDGYYYYLFYSDNDFTRNDIHTIFDIYKPTYRYANLSKGNDCINQTACIFPISFLGDETVIVEVPTRDGIEHESDDITYLVSKCHPRMAVYMIFPIAVLFLILVCAFL